MLRCLRACVRRIESRLTEETVEDAKGCQVACVFVSDKVDAGIVKQLKQQGVKMIAVRSAGFNNVDLKACDEADITVARVPAYSPYAVAEYATALILSLNRKTHHAYARVRDYNFSLNRLVGFDIHGKVGTVTQHAASDQQLKSNHHTRPAHSLHRCLHALC